MFKAVYKQKDYYFTLQNIIGNKVGIPCIQIDGDLVSIHLMSIFNHCGFIDIEGNQLYEFDRVRCLDSSSGLQYYGVIVFHKGCYSIKIKSYLDKKGCIIPKMTIDEKSKYTYDLKSMPPMFDFKSFIKVYDESSLIRKNG